jgi:hypothetical protein
MDPLPSHSICLLTSTRWYYGILTIAIGIGLFLTFFLSFETRYQRPAASIDGQIIFTDEFGVTHILSDKEGLERLANMHQIEAAIDTDVEKKPYWQLMKPYDSMTPNGGRIALMSYVHMAKAFVSPHIIYAVLLSAISLGKNKFFAISLKAGFNAIAGIPIAISLTYDTVLQESYGWDPSSVGLINVSTTLATQYQTILLISSSIYTDWSHSSRRTRNVLRWLAGRQNLSLAGQAQ